MKKNLSFDLREPGILRDLVREGIDGYALDDLKPQGIAGIFLFLNEKSCIRISSKMTDVAHWLEVGSLVFEKFYGVENMPSRIRLPHAWNKLEKLEKLVIDTEDYYVENGLKIKNELGELFFIACSENVFQIEFAAPFFNGKFSPEFDLSAYKTVSI